MWCIPPQEDARFVAAMEDVLEVYERPFDEQRPLVCLDEAAKQILGEVREPLPMKPASASASASASVERYDNEYERRGTCALFMLFEPLAGRREVLVKARRTALDYADVVRHLCDEVHPQAEKIVLAGALWAGTTSTHMARGVCIRPSSRAKHSAWCKGLSGITRPGTAVGLTWPRLN